MTKEQALRTIQGRMMDHVEDVLKEVAAAWDHAAHHLRTLQEAGVDGYQIEVIDDSVLLARGDGDLMVVHPDGSVEDIDSTPDQTLDILCA